jgi:hypothetical protein
MGYFLGPCTSSEPEGTQKTEGFPNLLLHPEVFRRECGCSGRTSWQLSASSGYYHQSMEVRPAYTGIEPIFNNNKNRSEMMDGFVFSKFEPFTIHTVTL